MTRCRFLVLAMLAVGCGKNIGDPCKTNVDCSLAGDRFCDTGSPGGYCTVEGCDTFTCPTDDAVCIRFFTPRLDQSCNYGATGPESGCDVDERCVCIEVDENGACLPGAARCAPESSERRWCMDRCGGPGDCREEYECRFTGTLGSETVPHRDQPDPPAVRFCAPRA